MSPDAFNPDDLEELVQLLQDALGEDTTVSLEPRDVRLPGVWVQLEAIRPGTLAGGQLGVNLWLIVPDNGVLEAMRALAQLHGGVTDALAPLGGASGDTLAANVSLPTHPKPMPSLVVPFDLHTTQEAS